MRARRGDGGVRFGGWGHGRVAGGAWAGLAMAVGMALLAGCGSAPQGAGASDPASVGSREVAQRQEVMAGVFNLLEEVDMGMWADYGRTYLASGRIVAVDFSSPTANKWGISGLDGAVDRNKNLIYIDQTVWVNMPPRHLAIVMLDELAHLYYRTAEHTAFDQLQSEFIERWQNHFGRTFNSLSAEDSAYQEWWDAFFVANPGG